MTTWRKRLDNFALRWQARLEAPATDNVAPWVIAGLLFVVLVLLALARSRALEAGTPLATFAQSAWLVGEGFVPESTLAEGNYLARQASFILYPIALLTKIFPTVTTLLVVQSLALASGVVPLWRLARSSARLRVGTTAAVIFAYSFYAAVHNANLADFHPETIALPALLMAARNGLAGRWFRLSVAVTLVLSTRADLGLAIGGLGVLIGVERSRRAGWVTAIVGVGWTALAILAVQPAYADGAFPHLEAFAAYGTDNPFDVLWGMVSSPFEVLGDLLSEQNFRTVVALLAPVLFLPVVAPRFLLPAVPLYMLYLLADVPEGQFEEAQQQIPVVAFVFVATVFALQRLGTIRVERVNVDRRFIAALLFTATVFFVRDAASSPYQDPWDWGRRDLVDAARLDAADMIPDDAAVRAAPKVLPLISERLRLFELELGDEPDIAAVIDRVDWVVLDVTEEPNWAALDLERFDLGMRRGGEGGPSWERVFDGTGVYVYRSPEDTAS